MFFRFVTKHACDRRTDGHTGRQTDRQNYDPQDRASIAASRGKKTCTRNRQTKDRHITDYKPCNTENTTSLKRENTY